MASFTMVVDASLAPGAVSATALMASYPLSKADIDPDGDGDPDDPTVTPLPHRVSLALQKTGAYQGDPNVLAQRGDTVLYTLQVENDGNVSLTGVQPSDPGPRFDGHPGTGSLSGFTPASADLLPGERQTFTAVYRLSAADIGRAQDVEDGITNVATAAGTGPKGRLAQSPEASAMVDLPGFAITKTAGIAEVRRGGRVPYTIRAKALGITSPTVVNLIDQVRVAFAYVSGSATFNGAPVTPKVGGGGGSSSRR
ncbi:DUF7507 domain-containing protein [Nitratireductor pacificus]|uniref:DUF7507 domain-containing protein n=1 Tax=Nitratireductor pacificus TaxID=1231180 RepID=UPI00059429AA|nr:hypothetical protein [Nitratireductor pacificus]